MKHFSRFLGGGRVEMCLSVITCFLVADLNLQRHKSICWTHYSGLWFDGTEAEGCNWGKRFEMTHFSLKHQASLQIKTLKRHNVKLCCKWQKKSVSNENEFGQWGGRRWGGVIWLWHCSPGDDGVQLIGLQFRAATQRGGERCKVSLNEPMSFIKREMGRPRPVGLGKYWLSWDEWQRGPASTQAATLPREAPLRCKWEGWQEVRTDEWNRLKLYLRRQDVIDMPKEERHDDHIEINWSPEENKTKQMVLDKSALREPVKLQSRLLLANSVSYCKTIEQKVSKAVRAGYKHLTSLSNHEEVRGRATWWPVVGGR